MIKVSVIGATALLLGIGCAWAEMPPTADPSSSGRSSATLSQNDCENLWNDARHQSGGVSASDGAAGTSNSNGRPAETSKSVALEDSRAAVENDANTSAASRATGTSTDTNASVAGKKDASTPDTGSNGRPAETSKSVALEDSRAAVENDANAAASDKANMSGSSHPAGSDNDQSLTKERASNYIADFAMVDKNSDGSISESEFQDGCKNGSVHAATSR